MPLTIDARAYDRNAKTSLNVAGMSFTVRDGDITFAAADAVIFVPFTVSRPFPAQRMSVENGTTVSGNTRMGLYDTVGALLASTAATAQSGAAAVQFIALSSAITLGAGLYFMALSNSGTTGQYGRFRAPSGDQNLSAVGVRGATSGGIVTSPTIVDVSTSVISIDGYLPNISVLAFTASQLVAP